MLPDIIARQDIKNGTVSPVLKEWCVAENDIYLLYPGSDVLPQKLKVFLDFLSEKKYLLK